MSKTAPSLLTNSSPAKGTDSAHMVVHNGHIFVHYVLVLLYSLRIDVLGCFGPTCFICV